MHSSRSLRFLFLLALVLAAAMLASACGGGDGAEDAGGGSTEIEPASDSDADDGGSDGGLAIDEEVSARADSYEAAPKKRLDPKKTYIVHVSTNKGDFDITLDPKAGPIAAANFAFLVKEGYYDGVVFHRIIKDFMVQTGDPTGTGTGGPGYSIKDDKVTGAYERGTVAMANAGPDTGGSQFFIVHGTTVDQMLGKDYAIFGKVDAKGMEVVDEIADVEVTAGPSGEQSQPTETVKIEKMELEVS